MPSREQVFHAINTERAYQEKWDQTRKEQGINSYMDKDKPVETWVLWMEEYMSQARKRATAQFDKTAALQNIRKVCALGVACMEYHGAPEREIN